MKISEFFDPIDLEIIDFSPIAHKRCFGDVLIKNNGESFPDIEGVDIAIIGINESRNSNNGIGCSMASDVIRSSFYKLTCHQSNVKIVDLGNIKSGNTVEDTYFAVRCVLRELLSLGIVTVVIGGSHDLTIPCFESYNVLNRSVNLCLVDSEIDLGVINGEVSSKSFLQHLILNNDIKLFNISNLCYQSYFVDKETIKVMDSMYFDTYRLGEIREDMKEVEPIVRDADFVSVDISAVRQGDSPANATVSPNGISGEELCQIAWYSGMSDKLSMFGLFDIDISLDRDYQTTKLAAQSIWYFIDGFYSRKHDYLKDSSDFLKYIVTVENQDEPLVFYKSKKSGRWWFLLDINGENGTPQTHFVSCSYKDYDTACENEIPQRWWRTYKKLI